jgi:hypothetical protein
MQKITAHIVSGLGDNAPDSVLLPIVKGSGSRYLASSKAAEFIRLKNEELKNIDICDDRVKNKFILDNCSYIPTMNGEKFQITKHELMYRILEHCNSYNNFRNINCMVRDPKDIIIFLNNNSISTKDIKMPNLPHNIIYEYTNPINLMKYELELIPIFKEIEQFLEIAFYNYKNK